MAYFGAKLKRAFTIVELAIVIGVIAVLAAIIIPTFYSLYNKADKTADTQLVKNFNALLIAEDYDNVADSITFLLGEGYDADDLELAYSGYSLAYNLNTNLFVIYEEDFSSVAYGNVNESDDVCAIGLSNYESAAENGINAFCVYSLDQTVEISNLQNCEIWLYTQDGCTVSVDAPDCVINCYGSAGFFYLLSESTTLNLYGNISELSLNKSGNTINYYSGCTISTLTHNGNDFTFCYNGITYSSAKENLQSVLTELNISYSEISGAEHVYGSPTWQWASDYTTATVTFTCTVCGDEQAPEVNVTAETTAATCTEDGYTVYTAATTFEGMPYSTSTTVTLPATGHTYGDSPTWNWDGYTAATATFECTICGNEQEITAEITSETTAATCTAVGKTEYTATAAIGDTEYTDIKTEEIAVIAHTYAFAEWQWESDYSAATAIFECTVCHNEHEETAVITSENIAATCTEDGGTKYTATVTFESETYTDNDFVITENATGHSYGDPVWTWEEDYSATAAFTCDNCSDIQIVDATVTSETTLTNCTEGGQTVYTATATFDGDSYTDTKTVDIAAAEHKSESGESGSYARKVDGGYTDYVCNVCGYSYREDNKNCEYTNGLEFDLSDSEDYYIVTGLSSSVTEVYIPSYYNNLPVKEIADEAFKSNTTITKVEIGRLIEVIGDSAFYGCTALTIVNIPENLVTLCTYAFYDCKALEIVYYEATNAEVENSKDTFYRAGASSKADNEGLTIIISANVQVIPAQLFNCTNNYNPKIRAVIFEKGSICTSIGEQAFRIYITTYFNDFEYIVLPSTLEEVGKNILGGTYSGIVYFMGTTEAEWTTFLSNDIETDFSGVTVIYYSETEESGCWHYDDDGYPVM
ncbi:MAG: leucine-rich repeat protein [Clostridia bacterium]|nr:leucine-rich repeat protein [Clostridia bacterium]